MSLQSEKIYLNIVLVTRYKTGFIPGPFRCF
ncbi:hypothetical protein DET0220 [Dehalococcoides mccartyi 195]|uniref:Uncharacterized protein n=1 Tax=Dehalococcoides mccartyi (strain ATCC BAA-2266 / KCTC 15142 / 195) TaxID=243164 RepID=Q3Z9Y1_DEHM1|nr:hypothetical protein DET0220 [Dehalococcoides mccartyi 195]